MGWRKRNCSVEEQPNNPPGELPAWALSESKKFGSVLKIFCTKIRSDLAISICHKRVLCGRIVGERHPRWLSLICVSVVVVLVGVLLESRIVR